MTNEIKKYLQDNKDLIINNEWDNFFKNAPYGIGYYLYEAGVPFLHQMNNIPKFCFLGKNDIDSISIPSNIKSIREYAFCGCTGLLSLTIPDNVKSIGNRAFRYCTNLASVTFAESSQLTSIGSSAFEGCTKLTNVIIPSSVTVIHFDAFAECSSLTTIFIPNSVTLIAANAFGDCESIEITYDGSKEQWRKIYTPQAFNNTHFTVHCIDGDITKRKK